MTGSGCGAGYPAHRSGRRAGNAHSERIADASSGVSHRALEGWGRRRSASRAGFRLWPDGAVNSEAVPVGTACSACCRSGAAAGQLPFRRRDAARTVPAVLAISYLRISAVLTRATVLPRRPRRQDRRRLSDHHRFIDAWTRHYDRRAMRPRSSDVAMTTGLSARRVRPMPAAKLTADLSSAAPARFGAGLSSSGLSEPTNPWSYGSWTSRARAWSSTLEAS